MVNIRLRDYDTGAEVAVMTRRVRGKVNKEKEFMQELEQAAFQSKYEIACRLVVDRIEKINKEISLFCLLPVYILFHIYFEKLLVPALA